jgi:hypothetical protein
LATHSEDKQYRDTGDIDDTRHIAKKNQCRQCLWIVCFRYVSCVTNVASVSGLFVFVMFLVSPMSPVSLDCLFSLCFLCHPGDTRHIAKTNNTETGDIGDTRHIAKTNNRDTGDIGDTRHIAKTNNTETLATLATQDT